MPSLPWHTKVKPHPGSTRLEINAEPDWGNVKNAHLIGHRDQRGRLLGLSEATDGWTDDDDEVRESWAKSDKIKQRAEHGELLTFRDVLERDEEVHLQQPKHRPAGHRPMLDFTEDWIKNEQDWPANVRKRKEAEQKNREEKKKRQQEDDDEEHSKSASDDAKSASEKGSDEQSASEEEEAASGTAKEKNESKESKFLRQLKQESEYIANLQPREGNGKPKVRDSLYRTIDEADQFTPDNWVARSSDLIRLTGKHPLNAEPPLTKLWEAGFVTPNDLHYVRSHGAVPRLLWEFHKIDIENGKMQLSMDDLRDKFESINIPVLIACDNVRRKELNMLKRTSGFNWGPGGVANAYWKGPLLRDVLLAAGVPERMPDEDEKQYYVHFRGADEPEEGKYETSITFQYIMEADNDVMLAYEMNGAPIPPDHGYPVRLVIPGYVGGRCVKWLEKIWISDKENDSYYHIWDNRTVPGFIEDKNTEVAKTLFAHPDTAIYEQMLNSVITKPAQGEVVHIKDIKGGKKYRIEGFAYNGRGDIVQRVDISLDGGKSWLYCMRHWPEKRPIRHGRKFWTWVFWYVDVEMTDLLKAEGITVRCWNPFKMSQPEHENWNILGSMNNCWYTVKPELRNDDEPFILFRHPVEPGSGNGGWKQPSKENQVQDARQSGNTPKRQFTKEEIEKHNTQKDCWIVVNGKVYDATSVLPWHPGGAGAIMPHAGKVHQETTSEYESIHDAYANSKLEECILGVVTKKAQKWIDQTANQKDTDAELPDDQALQKHHWVAAKLVRREELSHDTRSYTFELPDGKKRIGLGTCQHIEFGFHLKDRMLVRPYTPTRPVLPFVKQAKSDDLHDGCGTFDLTVKTYFPSNDQPGGSFSNILDTIPIGSEIEMRGPRGDVIYEGDGKFNIHGEERTFKKVSLVLGGTGLTPAYQLIARVAHSKGDQLQIRAVDANKSESDILLHENLAEFEKITEGRFRVAHILADPSEEWDGEKGLVTKEIMQKYLFPPDQDTVCLLCGPPGLVNKAAIPALEEWGYNQNSNMYGL